MSYCRSLGVTGKVGSQADILLVEAIQAGKYLRWIGDNLQFPQDVHDERKDNHKHLVHMFSSAVLVYERWFEDLPNSPEIPLHDLSVKDVLLSQEEYALIRKDCIKLVADVLSEYIDQQKFVSKSTPKTLAKPGSHKFAKKTETLPLNEQYYADDMQILQFYQDKMKSIYEKAGIPFTEDIKWQIGGDQLTRERFSVAKDTRLRNAFAEERFHNLGPVSMEFLHLYMNVLTKVCFGRLYNDKSVLEIGKWISLNMNSFMFYCVVLVQSADQQFLKVFKLAAYRNVSFENYCSLGQEKSVK